MCVPNSTKTIPKTQVTCLLGVTFGMFPFHTSYAITSFSLFIFFDDVTFGSLFSPSSSMLSVVLVLSTTLAFLHFLAHLCPNVCHLLFIIYTDTNVALFTTEVALLSTKCPAYHTQIDTQQPRPINHVTCNHICLIHTLLRP